MSVLNKKMLPRYEYIRDSIIQLLTEYLNKYQLPSIKYTFIDEFAKTEDRELIDESGLLLTDNPPSMGTIISVGHDKETSIVKEMTFLLVIPNSNLLETWINTGLDDIKTLLIMHTVLKHEIGHIIYNWSFMGNYIDTIHEKFKKDEEVKKDFYKKYKINKNTSIKQRARIMIHYNRLEPEEKNANELMGITDQDWVDYINAIYDTTYKLKDLL